MKFASKWEEQYRNMLELKYRACEILAYEYESITFRLAPKTTYTPDFLVVLPDGKVQIHEVKGFAREDAIVKFKVAAQQNPWFEFIMVKKSKTEGWVEMFHFNITYPQTEIISVTDHHPQKKDSNPKQIIVKKKLTYAEMLKKPDYAVVMKMKPEELKKLRLKLGKTLEEMTEMVGLPSKNGWERLEAGQHKLYYQKHIEAIMRMMK